MVAAWRERVHVAQGFPTPDVDAAPTAAFLVLFFISALSHMFIFLRNKKRGHFFIFNGLCIGFSMARVVTCSLRLAWMYNIDNRGLGIAATIFVAAGVLILFVINLMFAHRIVRGLHPHMGWSRLHSRFLLVLYLLVPALLVMVITATVQLFYTTDKKLVHADIDMQRGASTYFLFFAYLPIQITIFALVYPKNSGPDHFGKGPFWHKAAVVLTASVLLVLGAGFRTGTTFMTWKPEYNTPGNAPWWNAKWCFYFFNFTVELITVLMYLVVRIDLLFHIPDGAKGPGSYSRNTNTGTKEDDVETRGLRRASSDRVSYGAGHMAGSAAVSNMEKEQV